MKTILTIFIFNVLMREVCCGINLCPQIQLKSDGDGDYAIVTISPNVKSGVNSLEVTLELRDDPTGGDNNLKLVKSKDGVAADVNNGKNIEFKLNFLQSSLKPIITRISLNDVDICSGVEGLGKHKFDVKTTFYLPLSTPTPSVTSQVSAADTSSVQAGDASWLQALPFAGICGTPLVLTATIIGGKKVTETEYPWMVAMYHYQPEPEHSKEYACGASLISDTYVITAAHCTQNQPHVHLEFGKHNLDDYYETYYVSRTSWKIISHPEYKSGPHGDVALVSFHPRVTFTQWVQKHQINRQLSKQDVVVTIEIRTIYITNCLKLKINNGSSFHRNKNTTYRNSENKRRITMNCIRKFLRLFRKKNKSKSKCPDPDAVLVLQNSVFYTYSYENHQSSSKLTEDVISPSKLANFSDGQFGTKLFNEAIQRTSRICKKSEVNEDKYFGKTSSNNNETSIFLQILKYRQEVRVPTPLIVDWREEFVAPALRRFRAPSKYSFAFFLITDNTNIYYPPELIRRFLQNCTIIITVNKIPLSLIFQTKDLHIVSKILCAMNDVLNCRKYLNIVIGMYKIASNRIKI